MADWSILSFDLIGEIALKLDTVEDFVYFSTVCRSWNRASSMVKRTWRPSMPYLLLAENTKDNPNSLRTMYSISNDRCYQLSLPETFGARCWGSDCGWIVTIELDRQIHMFNPLTGARTRLPPQTTLPFQELPLDDPDEDAVYNRQTSIIKAIVVKSGEGEDDNDLIVVAIHTNWRRFLAFARPGDQTWTKIVPPRPLAEQQSPDKIPFSDRAVDMMCRDGTIIILYEDASPGYLPISDLSNSTSNMQQSVKAEEFLAIPEPLKKWVNTYLLAMYLVKSFEGDLLIVLRHRSDIWGRDSQVDEDVIYETTRFSIFELDFETKQVEQVKELGDAALFVGNSHSMSIRASDCRNCESNCIYFTDDYVYYWSHPAKLGGHDAGVFDVENEEINKFYDGEDGVHSDVCIPFWFMPRF